jgi:hypothetical protein
MNEANRVTLSFACDIDERTEWEIQQKGWFEQALVHLPDGSNVPVCFWDPVRLSQDLETELKSGRTCISEPGMIVIPHVTVENMKAAVEELYRRGYFDSLRSLFQ